MNQEKAPVTENLSVTDFMKRFPIFMNLHSLTTWQVSDVGYKFYYPQSVHDAQLYKFNGVFMELFMRKCLCKKYDIQCTDGRTEDELRFAFKAESMKQRLFEAYTAYIDPQRDAIDLIDEIKVVALSHRLAHEAKMENVHSAMSMDVDIYNLKEVMNFVDKLSFEKFVYKESCEIPFGNIQAIGVPDYIFDDSVIFHVCTSMKQQMYPSKKLQTLLYLLGHYYQNDYCQNLERQYTLIIYNPLLGKVYSLGFKITPHMFENTQRAIEQGVNQISS